MSHFNHKGRPGLVGGSLPKNNLQSLFLVLKGGSGSGNFGHVGRPGKRGGSGGITHSTLNEFYSNVVKKLGSSGTEELHGYDSFGKLIGVSKGNEKAGEVPTVKGSHSTIHNHPDESTFSVGDFQSQLEEGAQNMYVVTPKGKVYKSSITSKTPQYDTFEMRDLVDSVKTNDGFYDKLLDSIENGTITKEEARNKLKEEVVKKVVQKYFLDYSESHL